MSRYTRLESAVMDALAHDLRAEIPDLAGQFEESRPSQRRNSGFGLFTEMIVDRTRPAPASGPTGDLGTVHAMVGALPDPIAFKARVRQGVLLGLMGDSYGQDTRAIDFATVVFDQVFTVDAQGRSIPFEPAKYTRPSPLLDLRRHTDHAPPRAPEPAPLKNVGALQRVQATEPPATTFMDAVFGRAGLSEPEPEPEVRTPTDATSLLIGLWALIGVTALLLVIVFDLPFAAAIIFAVFAGRAVKQPTVLSAVRKLLDNWRTSRVILKD
jgi:hypothetical protein